MLVSDFCKSGRRTQISMEKAYEVVFDKYGTRTAHPLAIKSWLKNAAVYDLKWDKDQEILVYEGQFDEDEALGTD